MNSDKKMGAKLDWTSPAVIIVAAGLVIASGSVAYCMWRDGQELSDSTNEGVESVVPVTMDEIETDDISGWQKYENSTYGYEIKYPNEWFFHETGYNPPPPAVIKVASEAEGQMMAEYASLEVSVDAALGRTLGDYEEISSLVADGYDSLPVTVSEQEALRLERGAESDDTGGYIYVLYGEYMYRITWGGTRADISQDHDDVLEAIIGSFTFTEI
ncbi:MAG: hypothetical protein U9Q67_02460 [Patescibacteria group bacterium]|nr:hypothetical protein [Patescibacteria group bacterium]